MAKLRSLLPEKEIELAEEDFLAAQKIEQYRVGKKALYIPEGLHWNYLPLSAVKKAEESFRVVSGGHCVPIREKRPELDLETEIGTIHLKLEKEKSLKAVLEALA